jgi:hypothetical protein
VQHLCSRQRVTSGRDQGAYYHNLFLRGRPDWVNHMRRQKVKNRDPQRQQLEQGSKIESPPPNFYQMEFCFYACVPPLDSFATDHPATATRDRGGSASSDHDMLADCLAFGMASLTNDPLLAEAKSSGFMEQPLNDPGFEKGTADKEPHSSVTSGSTGTSDASLIPPTSKSDTDTTILSTWSCNSCLSSSECAAALPQPHPRQPPASPPSHSLSIGSWCQSLSWAHGGGGSRNSIESPTSVRVSLSTMSLADNDARPYISIPERCLAHDQSPPFQPEWLPRPRPSTLEVQTGNDSSLASTGQDTLENTATPSSSSAFVVCLDRQGDLVEFEGCTFHFVEYKDRDLDVETTASAYR